MFIEPKSSNALEPSAGPDLSPRVDWQTSEVTGSRTSSKRTPEAAAAEGWIDPPIDRGDLPVLGPAFSQFHPLEAEANQGGSKSPASSESPSLAHSVTSFSSSDAQNESNHAHLPFASLVQDRPGLQAGPKGREGLGLQAGLLAVPDVYPASGPPAAGPPDPPNTPYLELIAKVSEHCKKGCEKCHWLTGDCSSGGMFVPLEHDDDDECRSRFAKEVYCGKEWCPDCREEGSPAHNRRIARWIPKIRQFDALGYWVFTQPLELRDQFRDPLMLSMWAHGIQEILKRHGFEKGLRRVHFFGDESTTYNPHLNVLTSGAHVPPALLEIIKSEYAALLGVSMADVHYEYVRAPGKMFHALKYITRATFKESVWDPELSCLLRGFRNMVVWGLPDRVDKKTGELILREWRDHGGVLDDKDACWSISDMDSSAKAELEGVDLEAVSRLESMTCPDCGKTLRGHGALPRFCLKAVPSTPLGAGYHRLEPKPALNCAPGPTTGPPPGEIDWQYRKLMRGDYFRFNLAMAKARKRAKSKALYGMTDDEISKEEARLENFPW